MALEASDRLINIIWQFTCGCISRPTFKLSASLLDIMAKSKEISQDLRKKIVDLHKSGSSLRAISKCLKVPRSSVQTIVRNTMGPRSRHTTQEGDAFCLLEMNVLWCEKCKSIPRTTEKDLVKILEETGTKVSISTVKWVLHRHNLKGRSARKKPLLQNRHKKPDYGLQLHMWTKIVHFGEMSSGLMKLRWP